MLSLITLSEAISTSPDVIIFFIALLLLIGVAPIAYLLIVNRPKPPAHALLLISTNDEVLNTVLDVATDLGYQTIHSYRHEDVLSKLPRNTPPLSMILIDDSVPQAEAGLLLTALRQTGRELPPLILIEDTVELDQTSRSFRADAILERPLDPNRLRTTLRTVATRHENSQPQKP